MSAKNVPVAGVVLRDAQGRYLLVQEKQPKAYGLWNLPAGWIDEGETPQRAAMREAKEEVGLDVFLVDDKPLITMLNDAKDRELNSFLAEIKAGQLTPHPEELLDAQWFEPRKIEDLFTSGKLRAEWVVHSIREAEKRK